MYVMNNQPGIPCQFLIRGNEVGGLPNNPSIIPNTVQVLPQFQNDRIPIIGMCMYAITSQAEKNPLRIFLYNVMSQQYWSSSEFASFVENTCKLALLLLSSREVSDIQTAFTQASGAMAMYYMANLALQYQAGFPEGVINQGNYQELINLQQEYNRIGQQVMQLFGQQQQTPMHASYGGHVLNGQPTIQEISQRLAANPHTAQMAAGFYNNNSYRQEVDIGMPRGTLTVNQGRTIEQPPVVIDDNFEEVTFTDGKTTYQVLPSENKKPSRPSKVEGPLYQGDFILASSFQTKPAWSIHNPHPHAYNPNMHVLFWEPLKNGKYIEKLIPLSEVHVQYADHELDPEFKQKHVQGAKAAQGVVVPDPKLLAAVVRSSDALHQVESLSEQQKPLFLDKTYIVDKTVMAASVEEAMFKVKVDALSKNIVIDRTKPICMTIRIPVPFIFTKDQRRLLDHFRDGIEMSKGNMQTFEDMEKFLKESEKVIPTELWNYVNDKMTATIYDTLKYGMGIDIKPTSFALDYNDLAKLIKNRYGIDVLEKLESQAVKVIRKATRRLKNEGLKKYMVEDCKLPVDDMENCIVFFDDIYYVNVPWYASDIGVKVRDGYGQVKKSVLPEFFDGIVSIAKRVRNSGGINVYRFHTVDNVNIDIHESVIVEPFKGSTPTDGGFIMSH